MWTGENEMVMECRDCGYRGNWREFDFHFGDACPECGSRAVGKSAEQSVHTDAGDSAVFTSIVHASAESTSKTEPTPAQRG